MACRHKRSNSNGRQLEHQLLSSINIENFMFCCSLYLNKESRTDMLCIAGRLPAINCTYICPQKMLQSSKHLTTQTSHAKKVSKSGVEFLRGWPESLPGWRGFFCSWLIFSPNWLEALPGLLESLLADWLESLPG